MIRAGDPVVCHFHSRERQHDKISEITGILRASRPNRSARRAVTTARLADAVSAHGGRLRRLAYACSPVIADKRTEAAYKILKKRIRRADIATCQSASKETKPGATNPRGGNTDLKSTPD